MKDVAQKYKSQLKRIKKNVENSYEGFKRNYERYTRFRNFVFVTTMDNSSRAVNNELQRNSLEFNIVEAYLSRLCGEFSKNEPGIKISSSDDFAPKTPEEAAQQAELIRVLEGHIRYIVQEANKSGMEYNCYRDTLSGGFSSLKIFTDYVDEKSFLQCIKMKRTFDQTLVGFDMLASDPDKSDGDYCFEIVPMRKEDFIEEFPGVDIGSLKFKNFMTGSNSTAAFGPFQWTYKVGQDDIILVVDYYEKKKKRTNLLRLSNGKNMTTEEYSKLLKEWEDAGHLEQAPIEVDRRPTEIITIERFRLIQNGIIGHDETDFKSLPIKFIDGNSIITKDDTVGSCYQMTKPYFYNAEGAQRLKNYAGQALANELENMRPAQVIASVESIPENYIDGYRNPQNSTALIYNAFHNGDTNVPLAPPIIAQRSQIPPEISNAFMSADTIIQNVLGTFDASMSQLTEAQMSGKAIQEISTLSNSAAMPYIVNYLLGLQSAAQMVIDMIPKYYKTPRSLPVISSEGKHSYEVVNADGTIALDYEPGAFKIKVEAGVSFGIQQTRALQQITGLMNASPTFSQFINEAGLDIVLDNVEIRNVETLRTRSEAWMKQQAEAKAQMMQAESQKPSLEVQAMQIAAQQVQAEHEVGMARVEQAAKADQSKTALKVAELELDKEKLQIELAKIMSEMRIEEEKLGIEQQRADDERINTVIDAAIKQSEHTHDLAHKNFERSMTALESDRAHELAEANRKLTNPQGQ